MTAASVSAWAEPLVRWYPEHGRHRLPWRHTRDPWAVLVSEVMLQQTSVARVVPRWADFLQRFPDPARCATASLDDVLRAWDGLGYPRRARALHATAAAVTRDGWPADEAGLRRLPGVGVYTARALLALAFEAPTAPPRDVNLGRVAARAALGVEPHRTAATALDAVLAGSRPPGMTPRDHVLALFDLGANVCRARAPRCATCPIVACASRTRLAAAPPEAPPRRQAPYAGSLRELRGAVLRAMLQPDPPADAMALRRRVAALPQAALPGAVDAALAGLRRDGLLPLARPATAPRD